jgi:hypothetical protein
MLAQPPRRSEQRTHSLGMFRGSMSSPAVDRSRCSGPVNTSVLFVAYFAT